MRYLSACFIGEGPTDDCLARLGMRAVAWILAREGRGPVDIGEPEIVRTPHRELEATIRAANEALASHNLLLLHTDGKGSPQRAYDERIAPVFGELRGDPQLAGKGLVGVVPVHETEAWLLADGEALREVLGTRRSAQELGLPTAAAQIESLPDPKAVLRNAQARARGGRRRSRAGLDVPYELLADRARLDCLRRLEAFQRFESDLRRALAELRLVT